MGLLNNMFSPLTPAQKLPGPIKSDATLTPYAQDKLKQPGNPTSTRLGMDTNKGLLSSYSVGKVSQQGNPAAVRVGLQAKSPTDNLAKNKTNSLALNQVKTTGTQSGDLSAGNISSAGLNGSQSNQGGTNASLANDGSNIKAPPGMSYDGQGKLVPDTQTNSTSTTSTTPPNTQDTSYGGLISQLANRGQSDSPEVQKAREALTKSQLGESQTLGFNSKPANGGGVSYDTGSGNDALQRALYGNEQNALSSQLSSAVSTQSNQIGALKDAAGLAAPTAFGLSMNPVTGQPINMAAMQVPLQTALGLYNAGTPLNDPSYERALGPIGSAGWMAFYNALQNGGAGTSGGINPAAQSATQSQAISQGVDSQGQAYNLDTGLLNLKSLQPVISNFMAQSNINSTDSPLYNAQIGTYLSQVGNPGQWNQFQNMMGELRKFQSQLLASGAGGIPTDISNTINSTDISKLSLKDIRTAMETMDALGNLQKGNSQYQAQQALKGTHVGYSGSPATQHTSVTPATPSTAFGGQIKDPLLQGAVGGGLNFGPELLKWGSGIWTAIKTFGK